MAKRTIDELLAAVETVAILKDTVAKHDETLARILDKLEQLERRVAAATKPRKA